jgi:Tfp pilus assembly protein PilF
VANFHIGRRNWKRALELLEQSRSMHPWVPRTHEMLAFAYVNDGRDPEAMQAAQQAIRLDGFRVVMFAVMARVYEEKGRLGEAAGAWRAATHEKGGGLWVYRAMEARALARYGDDPAALASADTALRAHAQDTLAVRTLADLQAAIKRGCYRADANDNCTDPVAGWSLTGDGPPIPASALPTTGVRPRE